MIRHLISFGLLSAIALSLSCSGDANPFAPPGIRPTVAGITVRDENGEIVGRWRSPQDGGGQAAPNPFFGSTSIRFEMPAEGRVRVDVVAMDLPGESGPPARPVLGIAAPQARPALVKTLVDRVLTAGVHEVVWGSDDAAGRRVPNGFYRIRVAREAGVIFDDVYSYDPERGPSPPPDMLVFLQQ